MQTKQLDGITFRRILCGGANGIRSNIQIINDLNVSPVSGAHCGPWLAGYGIAFLRRDDEPLEGKEEL